jgi:predicted DNA-binding transcriptional regulator
LVLSALGISEFDERVYRVFLAGPDLPVHEIAAAVDAPASRVRHAVTRLESFGLLRRVTHGHYQPAGPQTALMALLNQRRMEAERAFVAVQGAVEELTVEYRAGRLRTDPSSLVEVLSGRDTVNRRVEELTRSISTHMWVLDKPPYLEWANGQPDTNETEMSVTTTMISRGVDIRAVYCPESMERPGRFDTVVRLAELGEQSRMLPSLPFKLRIMDRRVALVPLIGGIYDSLAVVHPSGLLDALMELFDAYWERAVPIGTVPAHDEDRPSEDDLLLLRMLKAGLKDHAVARQLGISARTATRRIATIMERLGTETRFQAGVEAAKRGWL